MNCSNLTASCVNGSLTGDGACFAECCGVSCDDGISCNSIEIKYKCAGKYYHALATASADKRCGSLGSGWAKCSSDSNSNSGSGPTESWCWDGGCYDDQTEAQNAADAACESAQAACPDKDDINLNWHNMSCSGSADGGTADCPCPSTPFRGIKIKNQPITIQASGSCNPCYDVTITITTDYSCGIKKSRSGDDYYIPIADGCCCDGQDPAQVYASLSGGSSCELSLSWTSQSISPGDNIPFPSLSSGSGGGGNGANGGGGGGESKCSCSECSKECGSGSALWKKRLVGNKIKIQLNKEELANRLNNVLKFKIAKRAKRNGDGSRDIHTK